MDVPIQIKNLIEDLNDMGLHARYVQKKSISLLFVKHRNNASQVIELVNKALEHAHSTIVNENTVIFNLR